MVFRRKVEMNNKKTSSWNLGVKGYIIFQCGIINYFAFETACDHLTISWDFFLGLSETVR